MRYTYEEWRDVVRSTGGSWGVKGFYRSVHYILGPIANILVALVTAFVLVLGVLFFAYCVSIHQYYSLLWEGAFALMLFSPKGKNCFVVLFYIAILAVGGILGILFGIHHCVGGIVTFLIGVLIGEMKDITLDVMETRLWNSQSTYERLAKQDLIILYKHCVEIRGHML